MRRGKSTYWPRHQRKTEPVGSVPRVPNSGEAYFNTAAMAFATTSMLRLFSAATQMRPVLMA